MSDIPIFYDYQNAAQSFSAAIPQYNINNETDFINIYHQDTLYYSIELSNMIIKSINYFILPI